MRDILFALVITVAGVAGINSCVDPDVRQCRVVEPQAGWQYHNGFWFDEHGYLMAEAPTEDSVARLCDDTAWD